MLRILILTLLLAAPAAAQQMTRAQEDAMRRIWDLTVQANTLLSQGSAAAAEKKHAEVLALTEAAFPGEALMRASALHNLAAVRADLGRLPEAETMAREALRLRRAAGGGGSAIASTERLLASILRDLERLEEARAAYEAAVQATLADPQADRSMLIHDTAAQTVLTARLGRHDAAERLLRGLEAEVPRADPPDAARIFAALGRVQSLAGRPDLAEAAYREAIRRAEGLADGPRWTAADRAAALNNLGAILAEQGRTAEAEPLFRQAVQIGGEGADPLLMATTLDGLADSLRGRGAFQAAYDTGRLALDLRLAALPQGHPQVAASFTNIGRTLIEAGEIKVAAGAFAKALAIAEAAGDRLRAGRAAAMLAVAQGMLGEPAFDRAAQAAAVLASVLPPGNPQLAQARFNAAWIGLSESRAAEALPLARAAMADYAASAARIGVDATVAAAGDPGMRRQVLAVTAAAWEVDRDALIDEAFQAAQWAIASSAARSTQRMAARAAAGEGAVAALARQRQDLVNRWREADRRWLASAETVTAAPPELAALEAGIDALDLRMRAEFPAYAALTAPRALSLAEVQARLAPDETLLAVVPTADETYVFAITADGAGWHRAAPAAGDLAARVARLRADLDPAGPARAAVPLDDTPTARVRPFDRRTAHALYADLLAPLAAHLRPRVLVVADGALTSLPLAVLVASPPQGDDDDPAALAATDWLAARHAFATLPAVASLSALRDLPRGPVQTAGFAGFGAPDFAGSGRPPAVSRAFDGPRARAEALRALAPLPGTRRELLGLAARLEAAGDAVRLGAQATEAAVRSADLSGARIVAFATHGLIAGDIDGLAEPALAFTPPAEPGPLDDGLLTASEAAELRLAADWVILSACNTASGDGTPGAEGLSGLASAFLYAGARGLLVSHWPVGDAAAERLTQEAVARLIADPQGGQAAALAGAMAALRSDPAFAHPAAWAPFVVVGDGR